MQPKEKIELFAKDFLEEDPISDVMDEFLKKDVHVVPRRFNENPRGDQMIAPKLKATNPPQTTVGSPFPTSTQNKAQAFLKNTLGDITQTIGNLADLLHMSPFLFLLLCAGALCLIICICCICCIRIKNKKLPKNMGNRVDVLDDLPLPDFMDEGGSAGAITYSITYDIRKNVFRVRLLDAYGLLVVDNQPMDPYVRVSFVKPMPDDNFHISELEKVGKIYKTKVQENTCNPVFNEVFNMKESLSTVLQNWLFFNIFDYDLSGSDVNYGYVLIRLNEMDSNSFVGDTIEETAAIIPSSMTIKAGDMCVILKLTVLKDKEELEVTMLEARDLRVSKKQEGSLFVSATLYKEGKGNKKWKKKLSPRIPCTTPHPYFNITFRFSVPHGYMKAGKMVLKVIYMSPTLGLRRTVGRLDFSAKSETTSAAYHWTEANQNPLKRLPRWHTLPHTFSDD